MLILEDQGPTLMNSFNLNTSVRNPISKYSHMVVMGSTFEFEGGRNIHSIVLDLQTRCVALRLKRTQVIFR